MKQASDISEQNYGKDGSIEMERNGCVEMESYKEKGRPEASDEADTKRDEIVLAPDGGWGWMIAVACFMVNFIVDGVVGCFGLIFPDLLREFSSSASLTSMAGSLIVGTYMCFSLLVGVLIRRFGCRLVSIIGGCIGAVGCSLSMFSRDLATFMLLYGVVAGIGFSMNSLPGHLMINTYFNKKRGLANGLAMTGAGVGVFLMAPLIQFTLTEYGWRGTMLISGGVVLNFCVCGALLRPLSLKTQSVVRNYDNVAPEGLIETNETKYDACETTDATEDINGTCSDHLHVQNVDTPLISDGSNSLKSSHARRPNIFLTPDLQRKSNRSEFTVFRRFHKDNHILDASSLPDLKNLRLNADYNTAAKRKAIPSHLQNDIFRRKDIFYSGSLYHLKEFKDTNNLTDFIGSMTIRDTEELSSSDSITHGKTACFKDLKVFIRQMCDISVFRNRFFIPVLVGAICIQMSQFIPNTYIAAYCHTINLQDKQISIIVSLFGASNILGRLSAGCLANLPFINTLWLFNFGVFMCGVACTVFPLCTTFATMSGFSVGLGYFMGYFPPLQILVLVEYIGIEKLTSSLGFVQLAKGFSAIAGPPLAGVIYEWTESYGTAVQFAGILSFMAVFAQSLVPILDKCSKKGKSEQIYTEIELPEAKQMLSGD